MARTIPKATEGLSHLSWWCVPLKSFQLCPDWSCTWPEFSGWVSVLATTVSLEYGVCGGEHLSGQISQSQGTQKNNVRYFNYI